ncbi:hypothetical protein DSECCO2_583760 [anaerobic digester metagenome]
MNVVDCGDDAACRCLRTLHAHVCGSRHPIARGADRRCPGFQGREIPGGIHRADRLIAARPGEPGVRDLRAFPVGQYGGELQTVARRQGHIIRGDGNNAVAWFDDGVVVLLGAGHDIWFVADPVAVGIGSDVPVPVISDVTGSGDVLEDVGDRLRRVPGGARTGYCNISGIILNPVEVEDITVGALQ